MATASFDAEEFYAHVDAGAAAASGVVANDDDASRAVPPPGDPRAEAELLGNILYPGAGDRMAEVVGRIESKHMSSRGYAAVLAACFALHERHEIPSVVDVAAEMTRANTLQMFESRELALKEMVAGCAVLTPALLAQRMNKLVDLWRAREAIVVLQRATAAGYAGTEASSFIASAIEGLDQLRHPNAAAISLLDAEAIAQPLPPLESLVREIGLVAGGGAPHLVAGFGFSGKTLAVQALALALAAGQPIWGFHRTDARRVVHVDLEQGDRLTRRRYQRLALGMGVDLPSVGNRLALAVMPPIKLGQEHAAAWRELMAGRDLIIVDSLRAASSGADENDSSIRAGLDMLGALSEQTGCRALVVHHARKPNGDDAGGGRYAIRGSSAIYDAVDSAYLFAAEKGEPIKVEHVKARSFGEPAEDFALVIVDIEQSGDPKAGLRVELRGAELVAQRKEQRADAAQRGQARADVERVRQALASHPGVGRSELNALAHLSGQRVTVALAELGDAVAKVEDRNGRTVTIRHSLRGSI